MTDLEFIVGIMRSDTDALGFIPLPDLRSRWIARGRFLIATDRQNRRIGYLLHGPVNRTGQVHINQVCIDYDRRRREHATRLVQTLVCRARTRGAKIVILRCALDLEAIAFWRSIGAIPTLLSEGGKRRSRTIQGFAMPIQRNPTLQFRSCGPFGPAFDPKHLQDDRALEAISEPRV